MSFWGNPSGILKTNAFSAGASAKREWGLPELTTGRIATSLTKNFGTIAIGGSFTGDAALYTETIVGVAYARKFGHLGAAAKFSIGCIKSDDWSATTLLLGLGGYYPIGQTMTIGAWADNITASTLDGNTVPMRVAVGALLEPTDWVNLSADVYLEGDNTATLRTGQEFILADMLFIRSGVMFRPNCFHVGLGARHKRYELFWSYIGHPELGGSTLIGLTYGSAE